MSEYVSAGDGLAAALRHLAIQHRACEVGIENRVEAIRIARQLGASWEQCGEALGMSRQTAHKRFGAMLGEDGGSGGD